MDDIKLPESEGCKGDNYHKGVCPVKEPFNLLKQRLLFNLEEIQKDLKRILSTIYGDGNGVKGVNIRVVELELEIKQLNNDIRELKDTVTKLSEKSDSFKWQVFKALFFLASGAGGAAGLLQLLGG